MQENLPFHCYEKKELYQPLLAPFPNLFLSSGIRFSWTILLRPQVIVLHAPYLISPYSKLTSEPASFMYLGRRHRSPGSETKTVINDGTKDCVCFIFRSDHLVPKDLWVKSRGIHVDAAYTLALCYN